VFNFSANHMVMINCKELDRYNIFTMKDLDTNRVYLLYDFRKKHVFKRDKYIVFPEKSTLQTNYTLYLKIQRKILNIVKPPYKVFKEHLILYLSFCFN